MSRGLSPDADALLAFWFGDALADPARAAARHRRWFRASDDFDAAVRERFAALPDAARCGRLDPWRATPRGALARVLALDQLPRNLWRGTPRAFAYDAGALAAARDAIERGLDEPLHPLEAAFVYLPFEHAEDLAAQDACVAHYQRLLERTPPAWRAMIANFADHAARHRAVIERFGRFPHRNAILGRRSTTQEREYLSAGGETFSAGDAARGEGEGGSAPPSPPA